VAELDATRKRAEGIEILRAGDSLHGIAGWLNETGVPTRRGKPWGPSSVRDILTNPRYCGRVCYNRV
jgi:site-specific DNA recombinase